MTLIALFLLSSLVGGWVRGSRLNALDNCLQGNNQQIETSLDVAADSRFSKMRSKMGISAHTRDFDKNMIVCRMKHEKPHKNIAYEFFRYN